MNVILNEVKNLLNDNTLSTLSMVGYEGIAPSGDALLAMTHTHISTHNDVILNVVKNLSESADVRRLCYPVDASLSLSRWLRMRLPRLVPSLAMTVYGISLAMTEYSITLGRSFFFFFIEKKKKRKSDNVSTPAN